MFSCRTRNMSSVYDFEDEDALNCSESLKSGLGKICNFDIYIYIYGKDQLARYVWCIYSSWVKKCTNGKRITKGNSFGYFIDVLKADIFFAMGGD